MPSQITSTATHYSLALVSLQRDALSVRHCKVIWDGTLWFWCNKKDYDRCSLLCYEPSWTHCGSTSGCWDEAAALALFTLLGSSRAFWAERTMLLTLKESEVETSIGPFLKLVDAASSARTWPAACGISICIVCWYEFRSLILCVHQDVFCTKNHAIHICIFFHQDGTMHLADPNMQDTDSDDVWNTQMTSVPSQILSCSGHCNSRLAGQGGLTSTVRPTVRLLSDGFKFDQGSKVDLTRQNYLLLFSVNSHLINTVAYTHHSNHVNGCMNV